MPNRTPLGCYGLSWLARTGSMVFRSECDSSKRTRGSRYAATLIVQLVCVMREPSVTVTVTVYVPFAVTGS